MVASIPFMDGMAQGAALLSESERGGVDGAAHADARLRATFALHYDFVWRSLRRLGVPKDAVDDAAQEVFMVLARKIALVDVAREKSFLFGTALRVASDARRARARRPEDPSDGFAIDDAADPLPTLEELTDQKRAREMLDRALEAMPVDVRAVFVLFEIEGMSMAEIAECLELAPGTVASRLRRGREWFEGYVARVAARGLSGGAR